MRVLRNTDITQLISLPAAIDAVRAAFVDHAHTGAFGTARVLVPAPQGAFHVVAGATAGSDGGVMAVKVNRHLHMADERRVRGVVLALEAMTGEPLAILAAAALTSLRTAAITALAVAELAPPDARSAVLFGGGRQASQQIAALRLTLGDRARLAVVCSTPESTERAARALGVSPATRDATRDADVVVTLTPSRSPIIGSDDVRPGALVVALGSDEPTKQELDPGLLAGSRVFTDITEQCLRAGELRAAVAAGVVEPSQVAGELGALLSGNIRGRVDEHQRVVVDSTGTGLQDAAMCALALGLSDADDLFTEIDLSEPKR
jgi:ornithine cyclodeaminase/alanine dehydrogenase-like protein (mu-crystallin family)